jgi:DNA-binding MarR family transcriptional regulator
MGENKRDLENISALMERIIHMYIQSEKRPFSHGSGETFTRPEIHTIHAIGNHPAINITELAKLQGVTKGAVSQMIYKLVRKGYVTKNTSPTSDAEVCLGLTEAGKAAYDAHREYHRQANGTFFSFLKQLPDDTYQNMVEIMTAFEKMLLENLLDQK